MDSNIEEYIRPFYNKSQQPDEVVVDYHYERRISVYRSSTVMARESWQDTRVVFGEEDHYEEFV